MVDKAEELYERITEGKVDDYFDALDNNDFNTLATAIADDDISLMVDVLIRNLNNNYAGFSGALNEDYDAEMRELSKRILSLNMRRTGGVRILREEGIETEIREIRDIEKPVRVEIEGRTHRRSKPVKFSAREIRFLQSRANMKGMQVYNDFLRFFGRVRTHRSITTKFYRIR